MKLCIFLTSQSINSPIRMSPPKFCYPIWPHQPRPIVFLPQQNLCHGFPGFPIPRSCTNIVLLVLKFKNKNQNFSMHHPGWILCVVSTGIEIIHWFTSVKRLGRKLGFRLVKTKWNLQRECDFGELTMAKRKKKQNKNKKTLDFFQWGLQAWIHSTNSGLGELMTMG